MIDTDEQATFEKDKMTDIQHTDSLTEPRPNSHKLFSYKTILWPLNSEEIYLQHANSIDVIFDLEGLRVDNVNDPERVVALAQLKTLEVRFLSQLTYLWKNVPRDIQGFQRLRSIAVLGCHNLRCLFSTSVAKLLVELEIVSLEYCKGVNNIVQRDGEEEEADIIVFPKVSSFELNDLPNLVSFCIEAYSFKWPSMKRIKFLHCPKLKTFGPETWSLSTVKKMNGELDSRPRKPRLRTSSIRDYRPKLVTERNAKKKSKTGSLVRKEETLTDLKEPRLSHIDRPIEVWPLFPSHMLDCLKNLESIELKHCHSLEVLFLLEELNVEESREASVLNQLRKLELDNLPKLLHIWKMGLERFQGFQNLRSLWVEKCNSLTYLFSPSIAKQLVMLVDIEVIDCEKIVEVLASAGEKEEKEVLFHKVNSIFLKDLPNLKCFCNEANAFEWPSLKKITVITCPNLRMFVPTNLKTPKLEGVYEDNKFKTCQWKGELNATIEYIFKGKANRLLEIKEILEILSEEDKSCFFLRCLFQEDYDLPIEYLVRYGMGRRLFPKIDKVAEARNRVHALVENLKKSFLLVLSEKEECVKMPDFIRDVAQSIADEHGFLGRFDDKMEEWPKEYTYGKYAAISLVSRELKNHPDGVEYPKLELLHLSCGKYTKQTLPGKLFNKMNGLKVLSLQGMYFPSLPQSIQALQNLRTLLLEYCELEDVTAIGALGKLEMLSFLGSKIKELPGEIRNLSGLKLLDLSECSTLQRIPPEVLSSLSQLEELYMKGIFMKWEPSEGNREGVNPNLAELISLSHHLMALEVCVPNIEVLPKDLLFKNQMIKFQIYAGEEGMYRDHFDLHGFRQRTGYIFQNSLALGRFVASDIAESRMLRQLLQISEIIKLIEIKDLKNILNELDQEGFSSLKVLSVFDSEAVEYVIDATSDQSLRPAFPILESLRLHGLSNLKEIYHAQFTEKSFGNLRSLMLSGCSRLKNVISLSIARVLVQLQECRIESCNDMEEIFFKGGEDEKAHDMIKFPQLTSINLSSLPRLIGFCTTVDPVELVQPSSNLEVGRIDTDELTTSTTFENDKKTGIQHTGSFPKSIPISRKFFSSKSILWLPNLKELYISKANSLEVVFDLDGLKVDNVGQRISVLSQLKILMINLLPKLTYVWKNVPRGIQGFQNLTSIEVYACHHLRYLFPPFVAKLFVELQSIEIQQCTTIKNIVQSDGEDEAADIIVFPKVSSLTLQNLPNLVTFCVEAYSFEWPSIKKINLSDCPKLKTIGSEIQNPRKLKKINGELDSGPQEPGLMCPGFLGRCLECVPCHKNYGPMAVSSRGTARNSQGSSSVNKEGTLTKLKDTKAINIDNPPEDIWYLFPSHMIECLQNLESIELKYCHSLEVIFQLEELYVERSHVAKVLVQLRKLVLDNLPKLMHIWKKGPERIMGFQNLRLLRVEKCSNLTYLFSPSIANLLATLEEIEVVDCEKIEEILARAREKENEVCFRIVNSILLKDLPNLKCFCNEANAFEWPFLKKIRVIKCPNLRTFVPADLKTPELEGVFQDDDFKTCQWKGDVNATMDYIFKGQEKEVENETQQQEQTETTEIKEEM